jgi:phosphoribosylformylglycinamidine cyclo-ligase
MPDMYADGDYDLAGFCVGIVERSAMIDGQAIEAGDALVGIASSGPHSNGYSLIRKVLATAPESLIDGRPAAEVLLEPTRIYVRALLALFGKVRVKGLAHITGGGISENLPRMLPEGVHAEVDAASWRQGPAFDWLQATGNIDTGEMRRTFNCGVGMIVAVDRGNLAAAIAALEEHGETAWEIGAIAAGDQPVHYV